MRTRIEELEEKNKELNKRYLELTKRYFIIEGVFMPDKPNLNGRTYSKECREKVFREYNEYKHESKKIRVLQSIPQFKI